MYFSIVNGGAVVKHLKHYLTSKKEIMRILVLIDWIRQAEIYEKSSERTLALFHMKSQNTAE